MKILFVALALLAAGPLNAQCLGSNFSGGIAFPTQLSFSPPQPVAGQPVTTIIGPAIQEGLFSQVSRVGSTVTVTGSLGLIASLPPPPFIKTVELGTFAPGTYTVNLQFSNGDSGAICTPLNGTFVVAGIAANAAPALGRPAIGLLLSLVTMLAIWKVNKLNKRNIK